MRFLVLAGYLSGTHLVHAQDAAATPPPSAAPHTTPALAPTVSAPASAEAAGPDAAPSVPPPAVAAPPAVVVLPPASEPAAPALPPPPPNFTYEAKAPRVVLLVPRTRAVRPRPKRVYGDAGAPFAVGAGVSFGWPSDAGYAVAGLEDRHTRAELFASYDVWQPVKQLVLSAGASFRTLAGGEGTRAEIDERAIQADLVARYAARAWLFPHVRASVGAVNTRLSIDDTARYTTSGAENSLTFEDDNWGVISTLGAGVTLRTKARALESHGGHLSSLSLGVLVEGGYALAPAAKLQLKPTSSPSTDVALSTARPGALDRSAPYVRLSGVVRF